MSEAYGQELILDLHGCDRSLFNREDLGRFLKEVCKRIGMKPEALHFWDDVGLPPEKCQTQPHTKGVSAVQFILTSSIVIHALEIPGNVYLNVFSCKRFDAAVVEDYAKKFFRVYDIAASLCIRRL